MAVNLTTTAHRVTGVAPLYVQPTTKGTTSDATTKPWRKVSYSWSFGDPDGGNHAYGAETGRSRNVAFGPIVGHVYKLPGTYEISCLAVDSNGAMDFQTITITVLDPDAEYTAIHFFSNDTPFASGTPTTGGKYTRHPNISGGNVFITEIMALQATGVAVYMEWNDAFPATGGCNIAKTGPWVVGANPYGGSGSKPYVDVAAGQALFQVGLDSNLSAGDGRFVDIESFGNNDDNTQMFFSFVFSDHGGPFDNLTVLDCTVSGFGFITNVTTAHLDHLNTGSLVAPPWAGWCFDGFDSGYCRSYAFLGDGCKFASLGSWWRGGASVASSHNWRNGWFQDFVFDSTTFGALGDTNDDAVLIRAIDKAGSNTIRPEAGESFVWTERSNWQNCKMYLTAPATAFRFSPTNAGDDVRIRDHNVNGTHYVMGTSTATPVLYEGQQATFSNELFDFSLRVSGNCTAYGINVQSPMPTPDDIEILNPTIYSGATNASLMQGVSAGTAATNVVIKNLLGYAPNHSSWDTIGTGWGAGSDFSNNTADADWDVNPIFVSGSPVNAVDFKLDTGSPYIGAGATVILRDAFNRSRWNVANDMGFHQFNEGDPLEAAAAGFALQESEYSILQPQTNPLTISRW